MSEALVAIVTGGAEGLGAAIGQALLKGGYKVCVADIQEIKGKSFVQEQQELFGSENAIFSLCDVSKESDLESTFHSTIKAFHKVGVLINNAGINAEGDPRKCVDVNLMGSIFGCRAALKYMGKSNGGQGGMVISSSSISGLLPCDRSPIYATTKHGIVGLTRSYGTPSHLEKDGVVFGALCPIAMDTALIRRLTKNKLQNSISVDFAAEGVMKLLKDRINGSILIVSQKGMKYIDVDKVDEDVKDFTGPKVIE